jgi:hypothetical protein
VCHPGDDQLNPPGDGWEEYSLDPGWHRPHASSLPQERQRVPRTLHRRVAVAGPLVLCQPLDLA